MADFDLEYAKLNIEQREAVDTIQGPLLVVAGPGSGKTQLLSMRVANILRQTDAQPSNILCLTFTDSAAMALRERLLRLIGTAAHKVAIHTFHSFGTEIIASYPEHFYMGATFAPTDELAQLDILQSIFSNLPYDDPLSSKLNGKYTRLRAVLSIIADLKKSGLDPDGLDKIIGENRECMKLLEPGLYDIFAARVSAATVTALEKYAESVTRERAEVTVGPFRTLSGIFLESLDAALAMAAEDSSTKSVTAWKNQWLEKDNIGSFVFADKKVCDTFLSISKVYRGYQLELSRRELFDYSDMVLEAVRVLRANDELRYNIQERHQFILVDEFQDTNDAQMQLLSLVADNPVHEGRPDVMAVGDDDQGIYKFQGAELSNMLNFARSWRDTKIITLVQNYRSGQQILDASRAVITQAEDRLENRYDYIVKDLVSNREGPTTIKAIQLETSEHEYSWVAKEAKRLLDAGQDPSEIAILGRQHSNLAQMLPHLQSLDIPVAYERRSNVLTEPHIMQLIGLARLVQLLALGRHDEADAMLAEVMSYPFWEIDHLDLWRLSIEAFSMPAPGRWMQALVASKNAQLSSIANFLLEASQLASNEPMEYLLDRLIGSVATDVADTEDDDALGEEPTHTAADKTAFVSPYRSYYFPASELTAHSTKHLAFLSSLRLLRTRLREYRRTEHLTLKDFLLFIDLFEQNDIQLIDSSPYVGADNAVNLMTAHKAKGLEFETVFILNCQEDVWASGHGRNNIRLPKNLPIGPTGDSFDDQLRLFFVAMTRTKQSLYLTGHRFDERGKESQLATFLRTDTVGIDFEEVTDAEDKPFAAAALAVSWQSYHPLPQSKDDRAVLQPLLEDYALSVTHLNNFLDVTHEGPRTFLLHNMLRFPQAESPAGAMGSAVHKSIQIAYLALKQGKKLTEDEVLEVYRKQLLSHRLSESEEKRFLKKGQDTLRAYLSEKYATFKTTDDIEQDFRKEGVVVGEARLTGKIDKMTQVSKTTINVIDFKTGSGFEAWKQSDKYKALKSWQYRNQLIFYKILVENSRNWGKFSVDTGTIDFIEPVNGKIITLEYEISDADVERLSLIIQAVWQSIMSLDFPDTSDYEPSVAGIKQFEDDLINKSKQIEVSSGSTLLAS